MLIDFSTVDLEKMLALNWFLTFFTVNVESHPFSILKVQEFIANILA